MKKSLLSMFCLILWGSLGMASVFGQGEANFVDTSFSQQSTPSDQPERVLNVSLRMNAAGYGVAPFQDTLFYVYARNGSLTPSARAKYISDNINALYRDKYFNADSVSLDSSGAGVVNIVYQKKILMSILPEDSKLFDASNEEVAAACLVQLKGAVAHKRSLTYIFTLSKRIVFATIIIVIIVSILWFIQFGYRKGRAFIHVRRAKYFKDLVVKGYTILTISQEVKIATMILGFFRWLCIVVVLYFALPIVFSVFPYTQGWADTMFQLVWNPVRKILMKVLEFLPDLVHMIVILFIMRYVIRFVKYVFGEIGAGKLTFNGFHADWATPTYNIVRFLLYALTLVFIFPYLPNSSSKTFQGISVFVGVLFSLGSTSAISNIVAGLVITYMRPFQIGDRIKIGEISGDVLEKNMLVTRIKTIKNEEITIPNSAVLSGNTINYTTFSKTDGLIVHSSVTIGYDVPWKDMHTALIEAALRTKFIEATPQPFVLQTSLDDYYVAYQINAYTQEASRQAVILSSLHQNIQDVCRDRGIEIMSPHYRAERDGNASTIPVKESPESSSLEPILTKPIK